MRERRSLAYVAFAPHRSMPGLLKQRRHWAPEQAVYARWQENSATPLELQCRLLAQRSSSGKVDIRLCNDAPGCQTSVNSLIPPDRPPQPSEKAAPMCTAVRTGGGSDA